jgi:protein-tyrosine phosphatase
MTKLPITDSYWVEEDRLLAGQYPGSQDPESARQRLDSFLNAGVTAFINLTEPHELVPYEEILYDQVKIRGIQVSYKRISIRDYSVSSSETMTKILNAIDKAMNNGDCVYVHCWGGIGRTGMVVGCYLVRHGMPNEQAIKTVDQLYKTHPINIYHPRSPETDEQIEFIRNWWEDHDDLKRSQKLFCEG